MALPSGERFLVVEASLTLVIVRVMLRVAPARAIASSVRDAEGIADIAAAEMIVRIVGVAASQQIASASCLPRAITAVRLMRRRKIAAALRIGGRIENGTLHGHAWVEVGGQAIADEGWPALAISAEAAALWALKPR